jgi:hypothetical protein
MKQPSQVFRAQGREGGRPSPRRPPRDSFRSGSDRIPPRLSISAWKHQDDADQSLPRTNSTRSRNSRPPSLRPSSRPSSSVNFGSSLLELFESKKYEDVTNARVYMITHRFTDPELELYYQRTHAEDYSSLSHLYWGIFTCGIMIDCLYLWSKCSASELRDFFSVPWAQTLVCLTCVVYFASTGRHQVRSLSCPTSLCATQQQTLTHLNNKLSLTQPTRHAHSWLSITTCGAGALP